MSKGRLGILVGGGPAPGLNGVISAATIEGINQGYEVIGFRDGFKYIAQGDTTQIKPLSIGDVKDIHLKGGSILGTARTNPTKSEKQMKNIFTVFDRLGITADQEDASNKLLGLERQLGWLREIGFVDVDCHWKWRELALLAGVKSRP